MSDAPQGEGWWQASDLKWYPPTGDTASKRSGGRWILPAALGVVIALIAAAATFFVVSRDSADAATVTLEPVAATGADPFTTSTTITEVADFPDDVKAVTTQLTSQLTTNPTTGTLTTTGTTPGLYGGTRDNAACDSQALTDYLTKNPAKARAWAKTQNIDPSDIPDYIAGLTSAVLTTDTLVTNHGYKNGKATARQSVLQAGTAVLIDDTGTPRARCSCGNPLTPPTKQKLTTQNTTGTPWTGFSTTNVTLITTGDTTTNNTFTFTDITTGDTFQQPIASGATTWVAVGQEVLADSGVQDGQGVVWTSSDGATWSQTASTPGPLNAVVHADGTFVAVGSGPEQDMVTGVVLTSKDGRNWSDPVQVPFPLEDVAYGSGRWVAIAYGGQYATSTDGTDWTPGAGRLGDEYSGVDAITFGDGKFVVAVSQGNRGYPYGAVTSTDGTTWSGIDESFMFDGSRLLSLAYTDRFGAVGFNWDDLGAGLPNSEQTISPAAAATSAGGGAFSAVTVTPTDLDFAGLGVRGAEWVVAASQGDPDSGDSSIWSSPDLGAWTKLGSIRGFVNDVATS